MGTTPDFGIPELAQSQANPDITHNEGLVLLQAVLNGIVNRTTNTPPVSPTEGDAYIIADGSPAPSGAWAGRANSIAIYWGGAWRFVPGNDDSGTPITMGARHEGMMIWDRAASELVIWNGSPLAWNVFSSGGSLSDGDYGDVTVGGGGTTITIDADAVDDTKLRNSAALSVIGRAANSSGNPADITAAANDRLLTRVADALGFGQLTNGMVPTNTIGLDKLVEASAQFNLLMRTTAGAGAWEQKATSSLINTILGRSAADDIRSDIGVGPSAVGWSFRATKSGDQTGETDNTDFKVAITNEITDTAGIYDAPNSRLTPGRAGIVIMSAIVRLSGSASPAFGVGDVAVAKIYKNGAELLTGAPVYVSNVSSHWSQVVITDLCDSNDYYEVYANANVLSGTVSVVNLGATVSGVVL